MAYRYEIEKMRQNKTIDQVIEFLKYYAKKVYQDTGMTHVFEYIDSFLTDEREWEHSTGYRHYRKNECSIYYEELGTWKTGRERINIILTNNVALVYDVYFHYLYEDEEE